MTRTSEEMFRLLDDAGGPSRELDYQLDSWKYDDRGASDYPPLYTFSVDAALQYIDGNGVDYYELFNDCGSWFAKFQTLTKTGHTVDTYCGAGYSEPAFVLCLTLFRHLHECSMSGGV